MSGKKKGVEALPADLRERVTRIRCTTDHPENAVSSDAAGTFECLGVDTSFNMERFKKNFRVDNVKIVSKDELVFDLVGIDTSLANAFRRILLGDVATVCIETVYMENNTSVIPDEVLAHRLGLVPLNVDPRLIGFRTAESLTADPTADTALQFALRVKCEAGEAGAAPKHEYVYSGDLEWVPAEGQEEMFEGKPRPAPVESGILIARLRPGQEIACLCMAHKGIGRDHAKFSPVATAAYRLLPEVTISTPPPKGELAQQIKAACAMGVLDIEDETLVVRSSRNCTMCRNCIAGDWNQYVKLGRVRDHFIFSIESTGALPSKELFIEAVQVLVEKCTGLISRIDNIKQQGPTEEAAAPDEMET